MKNCTLTKLSLLTFGTENVAHFPSSFDLYPLIGNWVRRSRTICLNAINGIILVEAAASLTD